jgi:hypothetical protein
VRKRNLIPFRRDSKRRAASELFEVRFLRRVAAEGWLKEFATRHSKRFDQQTGRLAFRFCELRRKNV